MTLYERIRAERVPYGDSPIAYILVGITIALEWVLRSPLDEAKKKGKIKRNTPSSSGSYPMWECYIKPRR